MKPFGKLTSLENALKTIESNVTAICRTEKVDLDDGLGRVLAEDITAGHSTPPFDRAAVDGYAVMAEDTFGSTRRKPRGLENIDRLYAGEKPQKEVGAGTCIQVATGVKMPSGADAVVMVEDVSYRNGRVEIMKPVFPGANIARTGEDIKRGEVVLRKGQVLDPGKLGVLASQGMSSVEVYEKPRVAVIPTGDEITAVGQALAEGQIYDINSHTVSAVINQSGGNAIHFDITGDTRQKLKAAVKEALKADLVVFSGGSSVGERDMLADILNEEGEVLFHGIQIKPGKPTMFGIVQGKPFWGMPGYPTSCLINAYILLSPAIRKAAHLPPEKPVQINATLGCSVSGSVGRRQFLPVRLDGDKAVPLFKESGAITGTALASGYIVVPENIDLLAEGSPVTVTLFKVF